jgi:hypothetical protein
MIVIPKIAIIILKIDRRFKVFTFMDFLSDEKLSLFSVYFTLLLIYNY